MPAGVVAAARLAAAEQLPQGAESNYSILVLPPLHSFATSTSCRRPTAALHGAPFLPNRR